MASWDAAALSPASLPSHDPPDEACTSGSRGQHPLPSLQYQSAVWYQRLSLKVACVPPDAAGLVVQQLSCGVSLALLASVSAKQRGAALAYASTLCVPGCVQLVAWAGRCFGRDSQQGQGPAEEPGQGLQQGQGQALVQGLQQGQGQWVIELQAQAQGQRVRTSGRSQVAVQTEHQQGQQEPAQQLAGPTGAVGADAGQPEPGGAAPSITAAAAIPAAATSSIAAEQLGVESVLSVADITLNLGAPGDSSLRPEAEREGSAAGGLAVAGGAQGSLQSAPLTSLSPGLPPATPPLARQLHASYRSGSGGHAAEGQQPHSDVLHQPQELFNPPPLAMADPFVSVASATFGQERSSVLVTPVCLVDGQEAVVSITFCMPQGLPQDLQPGLRQQPIHELQPAPHGMGLTLRPVPASAEPAGTTSAAPSQVVGPVSLRVLVEVRGQLVLDQQLWAHPADSDVTGLANMVVRLLVPPVRLSALPVNNGLPADLPAPVHIYLLTHPAPSAISGQFYLGSLQASGMRQQLAATTQPAPSLLPSGLLLASAQLFIASAAHASELVSLQLRMQADLAAARVTAEPPGAIQTAEPVTRQVWRQHLSPLLQDLDFLLATAPQIATLVADIRRQQVVAELQQAGQLQAAQAQVQGEAQQLAQEVSVWSDLADRLLAYCQVNPGLGAWQAAITAAVGSVTGTLAAH